MNWLIYIIAIIISICTSCNPTNTNPLTGMEVTSNPESSIELSFDSIYSQPIVSFQEYKQIDSIVNLTSLKDTSYIKYKNELRNQLGYLTDKKLKKFLIDYSIPLDSVSLFNRQIFQDFGVALDSMENVGDPMAPNRKYKYEVKINYSTDEFRNIIYAHKAFCSWEPTFQTELYASFIEGTMYMYNNFPSKFEKRYCIKIFENENESVIYTLIITQEYLIYSKSENDISNYVLISVIPLDGHYEWAYFRTDDY
ncbi:MAG: hypothetical protein RR061_01205 [Muribaculaceae bacterium]